MGGVGGRGGDSFNAESELKWRKTSQYARARYSKSKSC